MTKFTFDDGIPAPNNNPSNDQHIMLSNNVSTNGILDVDHISFEQNNGGTHRQMTFYQNATPFAPGNSTESQIYPALPIAGEQSTSTIPKFINFSGKYALNCIRAFGSFISTSVNGPVTLLNGMNVDSITKSGAGYTVALTPNAVQSTFTATCFALNMSNATVVGGSVDALNTLTLTVGLGSGSVISFAILQV